MSFSNMTPSSFGSSSVNHSLDQESLPGFALIEEQDVVNQTTLNIPSYTPADIYGQQQYFHANYHQQQHALPGMLPVNAGIVYRVPQHNYFWRNFGCSQYPYYRGMMTATYSPPEIPPRYVDVPARLPLEPETGMDPVFVNAKQYHAILRRRKSCAKAEMEKKLIKERKSYVHESRHQHAMKRPRGTGGRFAPREEVDPVNTTTSTSDSSKHVRLGPSETPGGESGNSQNFHPSPGYDFPSSDIGEDWLSISTPSEG
ncbi:uncharacterized protein LOC143552850 [Bidens hawaiensis]|uniref:uncharacterized protein LOC143552850 n=1 Tax=Bidens hawaiensis TaxID=980011 RepID=UPI00404B8E77